MARRAGLAEWDHNIDAKRLPGDDDLDALADALDENTVFGRVTAGMDVVDEISRAEKDARDRPRDDVRIESIRLSPQ